MFATGTILGIQFIADGTLAAEFGELSGGNGGAYHGPAWHRDDDGDDERWAACEPDRPAQAHGMRYLDACLVNVGDGAWTPDISQWTIIMTIVVQGAGARVRLPAPAGLGVRDLATPIPHRWCLVVQPVPQYRLGGWRVRNVLAASPQHSGAARADRRVITPSTAPFRAAGDKPGVESDAPAWCGVNGPVGQPAGPDHCLYRRLLDDDLHHVVDAGSAISAEPAEAVLASGRESAYSNRLARQSSGPGSGRKYG